MGGSIGARLAGKIPVHKLVMVNTPYYFWNVSVIARDFVTRYENKRERLQTYKTSIRKTSMKSNLDFVRFLRATRKTLRDVTCQALILQCTGDQTTQPRSAEVIGDRVKGQVKRFEGGRHLVFVECSELRDEVCKTILEWIM